MPGHRVGQCQASSVERFGFTADALEFLKVDLGMCLLGQSCCQDNSKYQKQYSYTDYYEHQFLQGKERTVKIEILCQRTNTFRATVTLTAG